MAYGRWAGGGSFSHGGSLALSLVRGDAILPQVLQVNRGTLVTLSPKT